MSTSERLVVLLPMLLSVSMIAMLSLLLLVQKRSQGKGETAVNAESSSVRRVELPPPSPEKRPGADGDGKKGHFWREFWRDYWIDCEVTLDEFFALLRLPASDDVDIFGAKRRVRRGQVTILLYGALWCVRTDSDGVYVPNSQGSG